MSNVNPVLERTWQFDVNNIIGGETTQAGGSDDAPEYRKNLILAVKNTMIGFASNPWTVAGSASFDTGVGAMDAVDRWGGIVDIRWVDNRSAQRSWIVLENSVLGLQLVFDCYNSNNRDGYLADVFVTPVATPFTGGSATARPTSAAEIQVLNGDTAGVGGVWGSGQEAVASNTSYAMHAMHSADGVATRIVAFIGGTPCFWWLFDRVEEAMGVLTNPWVVRMTQEDASISSSLTVQSNHLAPRAVGARNDGVAVNYYLAMPVSNTMNTNFHAEISSANPYDGRLPIPDVGVGSESGGWEGFHGQLYDLWWATETTGYNGRGYPGSTNAQIQFGELVFPWDGSVPVVV